MHQAETVVVLLTLVAALVLVAKKLELPYPVVLVLAGLTLSFVPHLPTVRLAPDVVFFFFLPLLIYPAALFTSWRDFRTNLRPILLLAIGLVLVTTTTVAWIVHAFVPQIPWAAAFALGAIVSPPDAIAASAVIRRLAVPRRIEAILEGESLVNDATALVALQFAVASLMSGAFSPVHATFQFLWVAVGGVAFGLAVALMMKWVQQHLDDPPVQITMSLLTPFLAYLPAEHLHVSGVLSVVAAGIYLGWHTPITISARTRLQAHAFWEMVVFLLNGLVFIIIGLQLPAILHALRGEPLQNLLIYGAAVSATVIAVRIAWVFPATYLPRLLIPKLQQRDPSPDWRHVTLIAWSGMRGVVSLAAAFALPFAMTDGTAFPARSYILFLTFCVILATLVLQGLSLPFLIRRLGIEDDGLTDEEERQARLEANKAAMEFIDDVAANCGVPAEIIARLRVEYDDRVQQLNVCAASGGDRSGRIVTPQYQRLQQEALTVERHTIIRLRNEQVINDEALRRIQRDLDLAETRLAGA